MKYIYILFICCISITGFSQTVDSTLISVPTYKLIELAEEKQKFLRRDSLHTELIADQKRLLFKYTNLRSSDSITISLLTLDNVGLKQIIDRERTFYKKKWWDSPWIYYIMGSAVMYAGVSLATKIK